MKLSSLLSIKSLTGTGTLTIPRNRFVKEHKKLVKVLREGSEVEQQKEAREQWEELNKIKAFDSGDYLQWQSSLSPIPSTHPPSLKKPQKVRQDFPQTGWRKNASDYQKQRALQDLAEVIKRTRRQIGKPEISRTAAYPIFPELDRWS